MEQTEIRKQRSDIWETMLPMVAKVGRGETLTRAELDYYDEQDDKLTELNKKLGYDGDPETRGANAHSAASQELDGWLSGRDGQLGKSERSFSLPTAAEQRTTIAGNSANQSVAVTSGTGGGYLVPVGFWQNLQMALRAFGGLWNEFHLVRTETGQPMFWPTNDSTTVVATQVDQLTQVVPAEDFQFGNGELLAYTMVGPVTLASIALEQDSAFSVSDFAGAKLGESVGRKLADVAWNGSGSSEPLGVYPAIAAKGAAPTSTAAGSSGGYVALSTAATGAAVTTFDGSTHEVTANVIAPGTALKMVKALDPAYLPGASWYMNASQAWGMRGVVDDNGRPLLNLSDGLSDGAVGTVFGIPVRVDNSCADLVADDSTTCGPILINGEHAMVRREVRDFTVQRLVERYADYLSVAYIGYHRVDSRSNDMRACVGIQTAAS